MSLELSADRRLIRAAGGSTRFIVARIAAPAAPWDSERLPLNIAFVLDRSASMYGHKLHLAREAVLSAIRSLRDGDRFSVVAYDHEVDLVVPSTMATSAARRKAESRVGRIAARGMSDLAAGWLAGCGQVAKELDEAVGGRCLLFTDGLINRGLTDHEEIVGHAHRLAARGVATTTLGVGRDFDGRFLAAIAEAGGGGSHCVADPAQIPAFVAAEVREALKVVARDVRFLLDAAAGVRVRLLNDLRATRNGIRLTIDIGALVCEEVFDVVLRVDFPRGLLGAEQLVAGALRDRDDALAGAADRVAFTYASADETEAQDFVWLPGREVATGSAARAHLRAAEDNRGGCGDAQSLLTRAPWGVADDAGDSAEFMAILRERDSAEGSFARVPRPNPKKVRFALAYSALPSGDPGGGAGRRFDASTSSERNSPRAQPPRVGPDHAMPPLLERCDGTT
ncbi:MAG: VWA domain-containing protein [Actinomycetes bacterium]